LRREKYDMVVTSAVTTHEYIGDGVAGFAERWRQLLDIGSRVVVLADSPRMTRAELDCLQGDIQDRGKCGRPAMEAVPFDPLREAARRVTGVLFVDVVPLVCPDGWCPAAIGNVVVYRDTSSHMTRTFARSLEFFLEKQIPFTR
jgi:hypothetical protein